MIQMFQLEIKCSN